MSTTTLDLKVTADARSAVSGLKPLQTSLDQVTKNAEEAENALKDLDRDHKIDINDEAIDRARREITDLQQQIRRDVELGADTRQAQRRIRELRGAIRLIEVDDIDIDVDVDSSEVYALGRSMDMIHGAASKVPGVLRAVGTVAAGATLGVSAIGVGIGGIVLESLKLADNLAQAKIAFTQFLGSAPAADKFLSNLQQFAAKTPFEFPELVDSSKRLLAFGIESDEIVGIMTTLGDAAALTGSEVGDLATVWGQMQAKGKVANEELLQLTEKGIPAYALLAESMGLSVGEVQDLASEGKLLSDDVLPVLQRKLDDTFGGGMAKQAETLSGLWSTMSDTLGALGTKLGEAFTPVVAEQIENLTGKLEDWAESASENKELIVVGFSEMAASALDFAGDITFAFSGIIEASADLLDTFADMEGILKAISPALAIAFRNTNFREAADGLHVISDELGNVSGGLHVAADEAIETGKKWAATFRDSDTFTRIQNDIDDTREHLKDLEKRPPSVKVNIQIREAERALRKLQREKRQFEQAEFRTEVLVGIDRAEKRIRTIRQSLQYLHQQKPTPEVKADITEWEAKLKKVRGNLKELREQKAEAKISANVDDAEVGIIERKIDQTAQPGGKARVAQIDPKVDPASLNSANTQLDNAAKDRHSTIYVHTVGTGGSGGGGGAGAGQQSVGPSLFGADSATVAGLKTVSQQTAGSVISMTGGSSGVQTSTSPSTPQVVRLAPRQVPVKIFLDGAEIADHLELKANRLATTSSVRRRA